jgi:hypothetical protein
MYLICENERSEDMAYSVHFLCFVTHPFNFHQTPERQKTVEPWRGPETQIN